jgi:hypothetical protein
MGIPAKTPLSSLSISSISWSFRNFLRKPRPTIICVDWNFHEKFGNIDWSMVRISMTIEHKLFDDMQGLNHEH